MLFLANRIESRLAAAPASLELADVAYLARAYSLPGLPGYQNRAVIDQVIAAMDAHTTSFYANNKLAQGWGGAFGSLGHAIYLLSEHLSPAILDASVVYGTTGNRRRGTARGDLLLASREWGRLNDRRTITNQNVIAGENIYYANLGLRVLGDPRAFDEAATQRYLQEACELLPWLGNDLAAGGSTKLYGSEYNQVTAKGLTREWGYVGAGYGELAYRVATWYRLSGNLEFRDQAEKMAKARAPFRRPALQVDGSAYHRSFEVESLLAWRGAHESDGNFAGYIAYAESANTGDTGIGMLTAAATGDETLIGYAKQMLTGSQRSSTAVPACGLLPIGRPRLGRATMVSQGSTTAWPLTISTASWKPHHKRRPLRPLSERIGSTCPKRPCTLPRIPRRMPMQANGCQLPRSPPTPRATIPFAGRLTFMRSDSAATYSE